MATTRDEIDNFHRFAMTRLAAGQSAVELDELVMEWYDVRERGEVNAVIQRGLADIEAGQGRPARDVSEALRQKYNIPSE